jgi:flagellar biosynthesis protein FlhB
MADDDGEKSLEPSEKRLQDAREKGDVPRSQEVKHVAMLGGGLVVVSSLLLTFIGTLTPMLTGLIANADKLVVTGENVHTLTLDVLAPLSMLLMPILGLLFVLALVGGLAQGRPTFSMSKIAPKWSKLSPIAGLKRIYGLQSLIEFVKTLAKFAVVSIIVAQLVWPDRARLETLLSDEPMAMVEFVRLLIVRLVTAVVIIVTVIWAIDYFFQYRSFMKRMMMTRQEVKDEHKQSEGDPHIKARLRALRMQRSRKRMMAAVPKASVVITNPTHYAIALAYEQGAMGAPRVVAKGVDAVAARIRAVASENAVPLVENPPLARALFASVELDEEIQPEHYQAVAQIISTILKLRKPALSGRAGGL